MELKQMLDWLCATEQDLQYMHESAADIPGQIADELRRLTAQLAAAHVAVIAGSQAYRELMDKSLSLTDAIETQLAERDAQLSAVTAERNNLIHKFTRSEAERGRLREAVQGALHECLAHGAQGHDHLVRGVIEDNLRAALEGICE